MFDLFTRDESSHTASFSAFSTFGFGFDGGEGFVNFIFAGFGKFISFKVSFLFSSCEFLSTLFFIFN